MDDGVIGKEGIQTLRRSQGGETHIHLFSKDFYITIKEGGGYHGSEWTKHKFVKKIAFVRQVQNASQISRSD